MRIILKHVCKHYFFVNVCPYYYSTGSLELVCLEAVLCEQDSHVNTLLTYQIPKLNRSPIESGTNASNS